MKRITLILATLVIMPLFLAISCPEEEDEEGPNCHQRITVVNNSDFAIALSSDDSDKGKIIQPDKYAETNKINNFIAPGESNSDIIKQLGFCYERLNSINIHIFDTQPVNGEYILLYSIHLSITELALRNWTIEYNGEISYSYEPTT
jgi:hypothetical protein